MSWNDTGESLHDWLLEMGVCRREGGLKYPRILWGKARSDRHVPIGAYWSGRQP